MSEMSQMLNSLYESRQINDNSNSSLIITSKDKDKIEKQLLEADTYRQDRNPYPRNWLTDSEQGLWDLYEIKTFIPDEWGWVARDPHKDIRKGGIVAIDFGTKSTVVAYRRDTGEETQFMRIGKGDISDAPTIKDYENPTAMHFVNFTPCIGYTKLDKKIKGS